MDGTAIEVDLELRYTQCLLADEHTESRPVLRVFFDGHFERKESDGGVWTVRLDEKRLDKVYKQTLKARIPHGQPLPLTACVGISQCAQRRNEFGKACATSAGNTHFQIAELQQMHKETVPRKKDLLVETMRISREPMSKGEIEMRVSGMRLGAAVKWIPVQQCLLGDSMLSTCTEELGAFLDKRIAFESGLKDTWPGIKNVRAPMDISASGIELTKTCFVPIEGFAMIDHGQQVNAGFYQNALERSMIRRNLNPATDYDTLDLPHKAELLAEMVCYAAQWSDYIGDSFELSVRKQPQIVGRSYPLAKEPGEDFTNGGVRFAGDCEDLCKFAQVMFHAYRELDLSAANADARLVELQGIAREYNFFLTLATVHGAKADDKTERIGAHLYGLMLPKSQVKRALHTNALGKQIAETLPLESSMHGLPTLFCEGTGRIRPMGTGPVATLKHTVRAAHAAGLIGDSSNHPVTRSYDPLFTARHYVASCLARSKGGFKMEIPHDFGAPSSFYLGNLLVVTDDYMQAGHSIGAFIAGNVSAKEGGITRGAFFTDIINQHSNFALVPCDPMPDRIMSITREAAMLSEPAPPYIFDRSKPMAGSADGKDPQLERLKKTVASWNRQGISPHGSVDVFMRPHQFSSATIDVMLGEMKQGHAIYKVDYEREYITNEKLGYQVRIYVDDEALRE